jgi:hypothetical protein
VKPHRPIRRAATVWRVAWTIVSLVAVQTVVCAVSAAPAVLVWQLLAATAGGDPLARWAIFSAAVAPSYVLFAVCLMIVSPLTMRLLGWHTPPEAECGSRSWTGRS